MEFFFLSIPGVLALFVSALLLWRSFSGGRGQNSGDERAARAEADRIIRGAEKRASDIFNDSEALHERISERFETLVKEFLDAEIARLSSAAERLSVEYENLSQEARGTYMRVMDEVSKKVSDEARRGITQFEDFVRGEMARYERLTDQGLEEWRRTMQVEVEKKKTAALLRVEKSIYRILFFVSKEVLGHAIDLEEHQALVIRALEDAKRQGFFDI